MSDDCGVMHPSVQDDGAVFWWCPVCDRQIITRPSGVEGKGFEVIEQGNFHAQHHGSTSPNLLMSAPTVGESE